MATTTVDIIKTPTQLDDLLSLVVAGTEVIIARDNKMLARMVPATPQYQRVGNLNPGSIETSDDFDAPLSDEFWMGRHETAT